MSLRNKCTLYKVYIPPVMTYAAPVFAHANPNALYQLQILQNNFCRRASSVNDILQYRSPNTCNICRKNSSTSRRRHLHITTLNGHLTGALSALPAPRYKIQPERNLHTISYAEMPTLRHVRVQQSTEEPQRRGKAVRTKEGEANAHMSNECNDDGVSFQNHFQRRPRPRATSPQEPRTAASLYRLL
ncbi:hypothetical protein EVAR_99077_1 [Eumeta japonica]|uniref:Uncharacterized protein n=1 Tax=Eumeta variegata TaxID=151549 RepID=A0A4C1ZLT5_EUMVA|nr:hypothetical protein EVAR_99077_1 [Eumeta japonica]